MAEQLYREFSKTPSKQDLAFLSAILEEIGEEATRQFLKHYLDEEDEK